MFDDPSKPTERSSNRKEGLLPVRHAQRELFLCDVADAVLKDDMASMEHPFFALTTKPDTRVRRYQHGDNWLEVTPSVKGLATIYDKDILIFATSQLMAARNAGREIGPELELTARDVLIFTNRAAGGHNYELLAEALERLRGTMVRTNIKSGGAEVTHIFGLVDAAEVRRDPRSNRITGMRIKLSDWLFNAINAKEVLTLSPDYFRLRKPLERRIYELARKHCGNQADWSIGLATLHKKTGSTDTLKKFRMLLRGMASQQHLPDYDIELVADDKVVFKSRIARQRISEATGAIHLSSDGYHDGKLAAPGWDIHFLEQRWRSWMADGEMERPRNPDQAFCGFCRKWFERNGAPK